MKTKKCLLHLLLVSFLSLSSTPLTGESFRVGKLHSLTLNLDASSELSATVGINESLAIFLPEDKTFIEGIEIKMDIPEEVASWMDSVACSIYDKVKPVPNTNQIDYSAQRQYVSCLPGRLSWILQIPLKEKNSIKANRYTTKMDTVADYENNVVFVRLQPVMKGVPEETLNARIPMTIKPLLIEKGQLSLNVKNNENENCPCTVFIDDKLYNYSNENNKYLLDLGIHTVSVISDSYRNEVRTVRIDQAKTTDLDITLKSTEPTLVINSPESALIQLDDEPCEIRGTEFIITQGEHKIKFTIGDYEILRTIQAIEGKTYTVNLSIDLEVNEE